MIGKDRYGKSLNIGDKVVFIDCWGNDTIRALETGTLIGFTDCYYRIKPDNQEVLYGDKDNVLRGKNPNRILKL